MSVMATEIAEKGKISVSQEQAEAELKFKLGLKDVSTTDDVLGIFNKPNCETANIKKANRKQQKTLEKTDKDQDVTVAYSTDDKVGLFEGDTIKMIGNAVAINKKDANDEVGELVGCCVLQKSGSPTVLAGGLAQMLALATLVRMATLQMMS